MTNQMCQNLSWFRNQNVSNHLTTDTPRPPTPPVYATMPGLFSSLVLEMEAVYPYPAIIVGNSYTPAV
jgi:hypothetical protein